VTGPYAPVSRLAERLGEVPLLDHHCHGILRDPPSREVVLDHLTEAPTRRSARTTPLDSALGIGVRAAVASLFEREGPLDADTYLELRSSLGSEQLLALALEAGGVRGLLVDTGYQSDDVLTPAELEAAGGVPTREVLRLEQLAARVIEELESPSSYLERLVAALARHDEVVAYKSVAAYRVGLALPRAMPTPRELELALARILHARDRGERVRVAERAVIAATLFAALLHQPRPLQLHVGIGDPDVRLGEGRPGRLQPFLEGVGELGARVVLLHTYPFHREAALLAHDYEHVFLDVGLALSFVGPGASRVLAEVLELAPWAKLCYSSDAFGLPELFALGAFAHRWALAAYVEPLLEGGWMSERDAFHLARLVGYENAIALYELPWPLPALESVDAD